MALNTVPQKLMRRAGLIQRLAPSLAATSKQPAPRQRNIHTRTCSASVLSSNTQQRPSLSRSEKQSRFSPLGSRSLFIQTENTPNPDALKFKPNAPVLPEGFPSSFLEYLTARSTLQPPNPSPLAAELFRVDGVTSVFYGADYITVTKDSAAQWAHIKPEVFALITQTITAGKPVVNTVEGVAGEGQESSADTLAHDEGDSEVISMIKELLETRIRPAIQEDGGDIEFRGLQDGWVLLKLRGACRTCDSSTVTLRNGIESMLMHYIEEVKGVQQVLDQEEEVAMREFAKFEEKLKEAKGPQAIASSPQLDGPHAAQ